MYRHNFRHKVVTGTFSFPLMALITCILWIVPGLTDHSLWVGLLFCAAITFLLTELSNRHSLLRIRSRMVSITYLMLMLICPTLHSGATHLIPSLCLVLCYFMLYSSYQKLRPAGFVYHAFFFAGIGSLFYAPMLLLALGFYVSILFQLRNMSWSSFVAGLLGLLTPYWILAAYATWNNKLDVFITDLADWYLLPIGNFAQMDTAQYVSVGVLGFLALLAFIHYFRTAFNDKIRTRMHYYIVLTQELVICLTFLLFPTQFEELLALFILNTSLLLAHYYALAKGTYFHYWFNLNVIMLIALGIYNYTVLV